MKITPAVLALVLSSATAVFGDCGKRAVVSIKGADGVTMGVRVSPSQFRAAPSWEPGRGEPPLSISQAIKIAEGWASTNYRGFDSAKINNISLSQFGCADEPRYWYYLVHFVPVKDGKHASSVFAVVLLDGTLVGPTKVDNAF